MESKKRKIDHDTNPVETFKIASKYSEELITIHNYANKSTSEIRNKTCNAPEHTVTCKNCERLATSFGFLDNNPNSWGMIIYCQYCRNEWMICIMCHKLMKAMSKRSFLYHKNKYHSDIPQLDSIQPQTSGLNDKQLSSHTKRIKTFFHLDKNKDILFYYHETYGSGLKYLMDIVCNDGGK